MFILKSKPSLKQIANKTFKWTFPTKIDHLNELGQKYIPIIPDIENVEYRDKKFRQRRVTIGEMAKYHKMGSDIQEVAYSDLQHQTWRLALQRIRIQQLNVMSRTYLHNMAELQSSFNFSMVIPKMNVLSNYLRDKTGFRLKPVCGMLDQRQFLNCLAFGVFCAGQFIRHPQNIDNAPQPDLIHDFVGHIPMFADPQIAVLSQEIGLLSLGASEEDIQKLSNAYLHTIELGLCVENGRQRAFGAAIASCVRQLKSISEGNYKWKEFEPVTDCQSTIQDYKNPFERLYVCKNIKMALQVVGKDSTQN